MKQSPLWVALSLIVQIALIAMKLDGTLAWPWWSWNPLAGAILVTAIWSFYLVAAALVLVNLGHLLIWIGKRLAQSAPKDGE